MMSGRTYLLAMVPALAAGTTARAAEKVLYEKQSPYNLVVVTEDDQGLRTLSFDHYGGRQSVVKVGDPDHVELPYAKAMLMGLAFIEPPKRMLMIGLGGGTIPSLLHAHYPAAIIDVVDIDPDVVHVAKEFFGFREDATMRAHVDDGRRFIEKCRDPYDIILLDAFSDEEIPYHLATQQFLRAVRRALSPRGIVVANVWSRDSNPLYDSMVRTYQSVFDELYILNVRNTGNRILIAVPRTQQVRSRELVERARAISKEKRLRFDLGDLAERGFRRVQTANTRGRILVDQEPATRPGQPHHTGSAPVPAVGSPEERNVPASNAAVP
ncbi:MAG: fused MFS/spermidine synthase [Phycisphaerae bacterium]|nr:fused MFS/spermidine synthase [Phycisphaerae bacterium]